ncbi:MAG: PAS domain S-box protein [Dehalococcoidia bacterium]
MTELRETGSKVIGGVPWGTHFCQFYKSKQDLLDILVPYFETGLKSNEFCMWITAEPLSSSEAKRAMVKRMPDFAQYLAKGQIEIMPNDKWYLQDGVFDLQRVLDGWIDKLNQALAKGYSGLRLTGNTCWLERKDWENFTDYEAAVSDVIGQYKMLALCTYCLDKCNAADVLDVVRNHEFALIKQEGEWELLERSGYSISKTALLESQERFRLASAASHTTVYDISLDTGKVIAVSGFEELLGYRSDEVSLTRRWWYSQMHPDDFAVVRTQLSEIINTAQGYRLQYRMRHKKGHYLFVEDTAKIVRDENGRAIHIVGAIADITQRKLAEDALQYQANLLNNVSDAVIATDLDLNIQAWNRAAERAYGWAPEEVIGKPLSAILKGTFIGDTREKALTEISKKGIWNGELIHRRKDGTAVYMFVSASALEDSSGNRVGMVMVNRDITQLKQTEKTLRETSDYLNNLLEYANAPIIVWDPSFRITRFNHAFESLTGQQAYEVVGKKLDILFPEESRRSSLKKIRRTLTGERWETVEIPIVGAKGEVRTVLWNSANVYAVDGKTIVATIAQGQDITERKQAEEALTREKETLQITIENTNTHLAYLDPQFNFVRVNSAYAMGSGYPVEDLPGKNHFALFPDEENLAIFKRVRDTGKAVEFRDKPFVFSDQPERGITYWDWTLTPVKNVSGKVEGLVLSLIDTTERKRAEEEIKAIISTAIDGFWLTDKDGRFLDVNDAYCNLVGYSREELLNMSVRNVEAIETAEDTIQHIQRMVELGSDRFETRHRCKDGMIVDIEVSANYMDTKGGRFFVFLRDITGRKKLDELKDEFIGLVSHEMRTPLTVIIGALHTILTEETRLSAEERSQLLQDAVWEAESLSHLLSNLLELSRAQSERLLLHRESINIEALVQDVVDRIRQQSSSQKFIIDVRSKLPKIYADPVRLEHILRNLMENAVKYSPKDSQITISIKPEKESLVVAVKDQGIGISLHDQDKLFKPFERLGFSQDSTVKGIGLGLLVCKRLVEAHGGRMWVESEPGRGATFLFTLPLERHQVKRRSSIVRD